MHAPWTRREFSAALLAVAASRPVWSREPQVAGRDLEFRVEGDFGDAQIADVTAVVRSAADAIWQWCPNTRWETPGFFLYYSSDNPITLYNHREDGRIAIGLNVKGKHWAQLAYQFSHEFCHALAGHSNDWRKPKIRGRSANHWLEESLCEVASLFALRSMGKTWSKKAPYPNWKSYASALTKYADERLESSRATFADDKPFVPWLRENEPALREKSTLREQNNVVARHLLPLFEDHPSGWESVTALNLGDREPQRTLAAHVEVWKQNAPESHREFITKIGTVLGVPPR